MSKNLWSIDQDEIEDKRSTRSLERDARKGNDATAFAAFRRDYLMQVDSLATLAEVQAAFRKERNA